MAARSSPWSFRTPIWTPRGLVLDEIRQRFAEIHYPAQPTDLRCTFSCGIAELTPDLDIKSMAKQADEALYRAKHGGRNRIEVYRPDAR